MKDRHRDVALFRYSLIREAADPALTATERGLLVRHLADRDHTGPDGERVIVSRSTIDRWIRLWRVGGFNGLVPESRTAHTKIAPSFLELAVALKRERPTRSAVQVCRIIHADRGWSPSRRTVQRLFTEHGLNGRASGKPAQVFGRFEGDVSNELWTGDAMHGPIIGGHKAYLLAFIDDHSRLLPGYRWCHSEDTVRLEAALRSGLPHVGFRARSIWTTDPRWRRNSSYERVRRSGSGSRTRHHAGPPLYPANVCWGWKQEAVVLLDIDADHPPLGRIVVLLMTHDFTR